VKNQEEKQKQKSHIKDYTLSLKNLLLIARSIRNMYVESKVNNMFLEKVSQKIAKRLQSTLLSRDEIMSCTRKLINSVEGWLSIIENKEGKLLRIDRSISFGRVVELIKNQFSNNI